LLELLSAYDKDPEKSVVILDTAKNFAEWLDTERMEILPFEITRLNLLQTYKRERELTIDEKRELLSFIEDKEQREVIEDILF
jgi:hypothetical protein